MRALTLLSVLCLFAACSSQSHDLNVGITSYGDQVIYKFNEWRYGFPMMVRTSNVEYPPPGQGNFAVIKAINVKDHHKDGTGGYPSIVAGGIGQKFCNIKLKSQRGEGYNFTITIYGRYV